MCIKLVTWNKSILWCTVRKTSNYKSIGKLRTSTWSENKFTQPILCSGFFTSSSNKIGSQLTVLLSYYISCHKRIVCHVVGRVFLAHVFTSPSPVLISHRIITVPISPSSLNLQPPWFFFSAGNGWWTLGDEFSWCKHNQFFLASKLYAIWTYFLTKPRNT